MEFIAKKDLEHGKYYEGECRNAGVARWNAETERFYYRRYKFGRFFTEDICHPDDDKKWDVFKAQKECDPIDPPLPLEI